MVCGFRYDDELLPPLSDIGHINVTVCMCVYVYICVNVCE